MQQVKKMEELGEGDKLYSIVKSSSAGESIEDTKHRNQINFTQIKSKIGFSGKARKPERNLVPRVSLCLCLLNDNGDPGNEVDISRTCTCIYLTLKVPHS